MNTRLFLEQFDETEKMVQANVRLAVHAYMRSIYLDAVAQAPILTVELGTREGLSTRTLARAAKLFDGTVVSCDLLDFSKVCSYEKWHFVQMPGIEFGKDFHRIVEPFGVMPDATIDILYLDTSELYDEAKAELEVWGPYLSRYCTVFFSCSNLQKKLIYPDGSWTWGGWDNQRGVVRAMQEFLGANFDETHPWIGRSGDWIIKHSPWGGGWTTARRYCE